MLTPVDNPACTTASIATPIAAIGVALLVISSLALLGHIASIGFITSIALISTGAFLTSIALGGFFLSWSLVGVQGQHALNIADVPMDVPLDPYWAFSHWGESDLDRVMRTIASKFSQKPASSWTVVIFGTNNVLPPKHSLKTNKSAGSQIALFAITTSNQLEFHLFPCTYMGKQGVAFMTQDDPKYNPITKQPLGLNNHRYDLCYPVTLNSTGSTSPFQIAKTPTTTFNKTTRQQLFTEESFIAYDENWEKKEKKSS